MKGLILIVLVLGIVFFAIKFAGSSVESAADPTEQGKEARAKAETCADWTEVLDRVGPPRKWRDDTSNFDFHYIDRFDDNTRDTIAGKLKRDELPSGFSFFYRFSDAATFAVNFDSDGSFSNIQDKEGKGALMDAAGG